MLDREIEQHWQVVKESYPDAVVFLAYQDLFIVRGCDLQVLATEFGIQSASPWCGFDDNHAAGYMTDLAIRGYRVIRATDGSTSIVQPPTNRRKEIERQRRKGKFLAIDPTLLFGETEIDQATNDKWLRRHAYDGLLDSFKESLRSGNGRALRPFGDLYVYQVGDWYELDFELTSMLESHVLLLAKAAIATNSKLPCRVVEPRCRRNRKHRASTTIDSEPLPTRLGQVRFEGW